MPNPNRSMKTVIKMTSSGAREVRLNGRCLGWEKESVRLNQDRRSPAHVPQSEQAQYGQQDEDQHGRGYDRAFFVGPASHGEISHSNFGFRRPIHQPTISGSFSGAAGLSGSNHSSLKTMRFLCFIARFAEMAMIASAMACLPGQRKPC